MVLTILSHLSCPYVGALFLNSLGFRCKNSLGYIIVGQNLVSGTSLLPGPGPTSALVDLTEQIKGDDEGKPSCFMFLVKPQHYQW